MKFQDGFDIDENSAVHMLASPEASKVLTDGFFNVFKQEPPDVLQNKLQRAVTGCASGAIAFPV